MRKICCCKYSVVLYFCSLVQFVLLLVCLNSDHGLMIKKAECFVTLLYCSSMLNTGLRGNWVWCLKATKKRRIYWVYVQGAKSTTFHSCWGDRWYSFCTTYEEGNQCMCITINLVGVILSANVWWVSYVEVLWNTCRKLHGIGLITFSQQVMRW